MKTIRKSDFTYFFMDITEKLTLAEVRLLYLLITEPNIIEAPQQEIADRIGAHRRTVNIGLKKLKHGNYIEDIYFEDKQESVLKNTDLRSLDKRLMDDQKTRALKTIDQYIGLYYKKDKKNRTIINEDFYCSIIDDSRIPEIIRYDFDRIDKYVIDTYPRCILYHKVRKHQYYSLKDYRAIHFINSELFKARRFNHKNIERSNLFNTIAEMSGHDETEILNLIKQNFPLLAISKGRIKFFQI